MARDKAPQREFFGKGLPKVKLKGLAGRFIVIDGPEAAGCSTQARLLRETFERTGFPTMQVGLGQSEFIGQGLQELLKATYLTPYTMNLFYATELADQIEHRVIPSLRAGFVVICDRYLFSLIARGSVRGIPLPWLTELYGYGLKPDVSIILDVTPAELAQRCFRKSGALGFWESGRDCFADADIYEGFLTYQTEQQKALRRIARQYSAHSINANGEMEKVHASVLRAVNAQFKGLGFLPLR